MGIVIWIILGIIFVYTFGFSIQLWRTKNKIGSIAIAFVAFGIIIIPFFVNLI